MSFTSAYPCLSPPARLLRISTAGSAKRPSSASSTWSIPLLRATLYRDTYYRAGERGPPAPFRPAESGAVGEPLDQPARQRRDRGVRRRGVHRANRRQGPAHPAGGGVRVLPVFAGDQGGA